MNLKLDMLLATSAKTPEKQLIKLQEKVSMLRNSVDDISTLKLNLSKSKQEVQDLNILINIQVDVLQKLKSTVNSQADGLQELKDIIMIHGPGSETQTFLSGGTDTTLLRCAA